MSSTNSSAPCWPGRSMSDAYRDLVIGDLAADLACMTDLPGASTFEGMLSIGTFSLTNSSGRYLRAKDLAALAQTEEIPWRALLEELSLRTLAHVKRGQPVLLLRNVEPQPADTATATVL